jgi:very-short-patch-repair endonuclease
MVKRQLRKFEPENALIHRRELRGRSTKAEQLVWAMLRNRRLAGLKFRRQHSIGQYIADFACVDRKVVIELDGKYHHDHEMQDAFRQRVLESEGFFVLRFSNDEVLEDTNAVGVAILRALGMSPSP